MGRTARGNGGQHRTFERELKELSSFTAGFTTRRYLDSTAQEGGKTGEFYREMADAIGTDLDVEIKVSIPKDGFSPVRDANSKAR